MKKKILIVSEYFYPSNNSTSYFITQIAEKLSNKHDIQIICNQELKEHKELDFLDKKNITRIRESKLNKNNLFSRLLKLIISIK